MEGEGMQPPDLEPEVSENGEPIPLEPGSGVLEMHPNGYGFLRSVETNYVRERTDPFVPVTMIERLGVWKRRWMWLIQGVMSASRAMANG